MFRRGGGVVCPGLSWYYGPRGCQVVCQCQQPDIHAGFPCIPEEAIDGAWRWRLISLGEQQGTHMVAHDAAQPVNLQIADTEARRALADDLRSQPLVINK